MAILRLGTHIVPVAASREFLLGKGFGPKTLSWTYQDRERLYSQRVFEVTTAGEVVWVFTTSWEPTKERLMPTRAVRVVAR